MTPTKLDKESNSVCLDYIEQDACVSRRLKIVFSFLADLLQHFYGRNKLFFHVEIAGSEARCARRTGTALDGKFFILYFLRACFAPAANPLVPYCLPSLVPAPAKVALVFPQQQRMEIP